MTIAWINLSTRWSLSSVQAALNVIISVLATVGIWSFSRYWWQRGCIGILRGKTGVPLSALCNLAGPGDGWDVVWVLRKRVLYKENWRLLLQLVVVIAITLASMLSGPIAKVSLRINPTIQPTELEVLQATKGAGPFGNLLEAEVLWNETINSLNKAAFPTNQLLDYLPPSSAAWAYVASEWNPTWTMECISTPETILHNVTSPGNYTFYEPIDAFPAYRDTYDESWLDNSKYRVQVDYNSWQMFIDPKHPQILDAMFFILIQSDPMINDRMDTNNETLQVSMSILHAQHFGLSSGYDATEAGAALREPFGPVGNASYTRVECNITRKPEVQDENSIPWVWTNDTYAITMSYRTYWTYQMEFRDSKNQTVSTPTPEELLRFYQAYMATVNTINQAAQTLLRVSTWMDTVQLSVIFLALAIILTSLTLWQACRYLWFSRQHKSKLEQVYVPDGKMEWMIHAARVAAYEDDEALEARRAKDRDHFREAIFGYYHSESVKSDARLRPPALARVYTSRTSISGASPSTTRYSLSRGTSQRSCPPLTVHEKRKTGHENNKNEHSAKENEHHGKEGGHNLKRHPSSVTSYSELELIVSPAEDNSRTSHHGDNLHADEKMFNPEISTKSSTDGSRPSVNLETHSPSTSFRSIVPETDEIDTKDDTFKSLYEKQ